MESVDSFVYLTSSVCLFLVSSLPVQQRQPLSWGDANGEASSLLVWGGWWASYPWKPQRRPGHGWMRSAKTPKQLLVIQTGKSGTSGGSGGSRVWFHKLVRSPQMTPWTLLRASEVPHIATAYITDIVYAPLSLPNTLGGVFETHSVVKVCKGLHSQQGVEVKHN